MQFVFRAAWELLDTGNRGHSTPGQGNATKRLSQVHDYPEAMRALDV